MYYPPYYPPYRQPTSIRTILIITVVVLAIIVGLYFYLKTSAEKALKEELPSQYADEKYTAEESKKIRYYASAIQNDLGGFNWLGHDYDLYIAFAKESDRIFEGTAVDYKRLTGNSLRADFSGDQLSFQGWDHITSNLYQTVLQRLNTLAVA